MSEAELQDAVIQLAVLLRWRWHHCHDSRRTQSGYPDLHLVRGGRSLFVELKVGRNRPTKEQQAWLDDLERAGHEVRVWREAEYPDVILRELEKA